MDYGGVRMTPALRKLLSSSERGVQFHMGNLSSALKAVRREIESHGLLEHVLSGSSPDSVIHKKDTDFWYKDVAAVKIILPYISSDVVRRWPLWFDDVVAIRSLCPVPFERVRRRWSPGYPVTATRLLTFLHIVCQPFRFTDLQRELRDRIYDLVISVQIWITPKGKVRDYPLVTVSATVKSKMYGCDDPVQVPALLQVSRQVRKEAAQIYYQTKVFCLRAYCEGGTVDVLEEVRRWITHIGPDAVRNLRRLEVTLEEYNGRDYTFCVYFSTKYGLTAGVTHYGGNYHGRNSFTILEPEEEELRDDAVAKRRKDEYLAIVEQRRAENGWEGQSIADYFLGNVDALRHALNGPPRRWDADGQEWKYCEEEGHDVPTCTQCHSGPW